MYLRNDFSLEAHKTEAITGLVLKAEQSLSFNISDDGLFDCIMMGSEIDDTTGIVEAINEGTTGVYTAPGDDWIFYIVPVGKSARVKVLVTNTGASTDSFSVSIDITPTEHQGPQ